MHPSAPVDLLTPGEPVTYRSSLPVPGAAGSTSVRGRGCTTSARCTSTRRPTCWHGRGSWNPGKTAFRVDSGVDLALHRREGYLIWDMDGRRLIDMHLNGGTYNLGHRNPEVMTAVVDGMARFDIGT